MYKKILSFITVLCLVCCNIVFGVSAATPKLTVSTVSDVAPGQDVEVTVSISQNPGIATLYFELEYDKTKITPYPYCEKNNLVATGGGYSSNVLEALEEDVNLETYDYVTVQYVKASNITGNGVLFTYKFKVKSTAQGTVDLKIKNVVSHAEDTSDVLFDTEDGAINITDVTTPSLTVSSPSGFAGDTIDVEVNMLNNPGIAGFKYRLGFDKNVLTPVSAQANTDVLTNGEAMSNVDTAAGNDLANLTYVTGYWADTNNITADGVVYTYKFKINENAANGTYPLTLAYNSSDIVDKTGTPVDFDIINGGVNVLKSVDSPKIEVSKVSAKAGENVQVTVLIADNPGIAGFKYRLAFDKNVLTPVSAQANTAVLTAGDAMSNVDTAAGNDFTNLTYVTGSWQNTNNITANGVVYTYTFKVKDTAAVGTYNLTLTYDSFDIVDKDGRAVTFAVTNGEVKVLAPTGSPKIEVSKASAKAGENVQVTVSIADNPGIAGFKYRLAFDKNVLTPVSAQANTTVLTAGDAMSNVDTASGNDLANLTYVTGSWQNTNNITANGVVYTYTFKVKDTAAVGTYNLTLTYDSFDIVDKNGTAVTFAVTNGEVKIIAPAVSPKIEVSKVSAKAGENVQVTVSIADNPGIAGFKYRLAFDKNVLTPVSAQANTTVLTAGDAMSNVDTASGNDLANLTYVTGSWQNTNNITANGVVYTYTFKVKDTAAVGTYNLTLTYDSFDIVDKDGRAVTFAVTNGEVKVLAPLVLPKIEVSKVSAKAGENVQVTVSIADNPGIAGIKYRLAFDKNVLTPVKATANAAFFTKGEAMSNVDTTSGNDLANLTYVTGYWADTENINTNGVMFTYTFKVKDTAALGKTPLTLTYNASDIVDKNGNAIAAVVTNGEVTVTKPAQIPDVKVLTAKAIAGEEVKISVSLNNNPGIAGIKYRLAFDKNVLTPVSATANSAFFTKGEAMSNVDTTSGNDLANLTYVTGYWADAENITSNGIMFTYTFKVSDSAPLGEIPLNLTYETADVVNKAGETITLNVTNGAVKVLDPATLPKIEVSKAEATTGENIKITVSMSGNTGIAGIKYRLGFDKNVLTPVSAQANNAFFTKGEAMSNIDSISGTDLATLNYVTGYWADTENITSNGVMFTYTFKVLDTAAAGTTPLEFSYEAADVVDKTGETVHLAVTNGEVTVTGPAKTPKITVSEETAIAGTEVAVTVSMEENSGIAGLKFRLGFDKNVLTPVSAQANNAFFTEGEALTNVDTASGNDLSALEYVTGSWQNATNITSTGVMFTYVFKVASTAPIGDIPLTLTYEEADIITQNGTKLACDVTNGKITVTGQPEFIVSSTNADAGDEIEITVSAQNNPGIAGLKYRLAFDKTILTPVSAEANYTFFTDGEALTNVDTASGNDLSALEYVTGSWQNTNEITSNGVMFTYKFKVNRRATTVETPLTLTYVTGDVIDKAGNAVTFAVTNGKVSVTEVPLDVITGVTLSDDTVEYDGTAKQLLIEGTLPSGVTATYEGNDNNIEPGTYPVKVTLSGEDYETLVLEATLTISKITATVTNISDISKVYDDAAVTAPTYSTNSNGAVTINYYDAEDNLLTEAPKNAGTYKVVITIEEASYYTEVTEEKAFTIAKADATVTNISDISKVYDDAAVLAPTYNVTGDGAVTVEYYDSEGNLLTEAPKTAGSYTVKVVVAEGTNYKATSEEKAFTIAKADATVTNISDISKVYDDAAVLAPTYETKADGAVTIKYYDAENNLLTEAPKNAGSYKVVVEIAEGTNYKAASGEANFTIEKADGTLNPAYSVPVIATDMVYDENRKLQDVTLPDNWAWVTPDTAVAFGDNNYKATYTSQNPNYKDVENVDVLISITQKATIDLTNIALNNAIFVYDGEVKSIKVEGEVPETVTVTYEGNEAKDPGVYEVKATLSREFYNDEEITAKIVIAPAPTPITVRYTGVLTLQKVTGLPEGWTWENPDFRITSVTGLYPAVYTDDITGLSITENVSVTANRRSSSSPTWSKPEQETIEFTDTDGHWAEDNILKAAENGLFEGYEDGSFRPDIGVTRQEMAVVLVRLLGMTKELSKVELQDYNDADAIASWAADSVALLTDKGIYTGYDDGNFYPKQIITREQLCTILARALENKPKNMKTLPFGDFSEWAREYVQTMYTLGVVQGYEDGTFRGTNNVTRAEAATMLLRYKK